MQRQCRQRLAHPRCRDRQPDDSPCVGSVSPPSLWQSPGSRPDDQAPARSGARRGRSPIASWPRWIYGAGRWSERSARDLATSRCGSRGPWVRRGMSTRWIPSPAAGGAARTACPGARPQRHARPGARPRSGLAPRNVRSRVDRERVSPLRRRPGAPASRHPRAHRERARGEHRLGRPRDTGGPAAGPPRAARAVPARRGARRFVARQRASLLAAPYFLELGRKKSSRVTR